MDGMDGDTDTDTDALPPPRPPPRSSSGARPAGVVAPPSSAAATAAAARSAAPPSPRGPGVASAPAPAPAPAPSPAPATRLAPPAAQPQPQQQQQQQHTAALGGLPADNPYNARAGASAHALSPNSVSPGARSPATQHKVMAPAPAAAPLAAPPSPMSLRNGGAAVPVPAPAAAPQAATPSPLEKLELKHGFAESMKEERTKHSKIWLALNPQPLAFQTARDRAEREENKEVLSDPSVTRLIHEMKSGVAHAPPPSLVAGEEDLKDAEELPAQEEEEEEEEEEEVVDKNNLPGFDKDVIDMLAARRKERELQEQKRRDELKQKFLAEKRASQEALEKEMA
ncbi:unnamed protein product, partial [Ilex paraguariensis]